MAKIKDYLLRYKIIILILIFLPLFSFAHCPLCTAGAGIGAIIAKSLGMKSSAIGVWLGAFSVALGWWIANILRIGSLDVPVWPFKQSIVSLDSSPEATQPGLGFRQSSRRNESRETNAPSLARRARSPNIEQILKFFLILVSFLSIILPLKLYFYEVGSFYLYLFGDYGSLFNRTYVYDKFLFGSIIGGLIILISPLISKKIIQIRQGKIFPYQGLIITFILLVIVSIFFQIKI